MKLVLDARRRVVSALVYPAVLVGLSVAMIIVMAIYVVPKFMGFFEDLDAELPLITRIVLGGLRRSRSRQLAGASWSALAGGVRRLAPLGAHRPRAAWRSTA